MDDAAGLIEPHIPALRRYAYALVRQHDAADDLVQDCLERALKRWLLRRRDASLKAWLFAILRNQFISQYRQTRRRGAHVTLDDAAGMMSGGPLPGDTNGVRDILTGLDLLPEEQRSLLLLIGVEDLSYDEAARVTGVPIGTVMSRLSRGRQRLRAYLDGDSQPVAVLRRVK